MKISKGDNEGLRVCFSLLIIGLIYGVFSWYAYMKTNDIAWLIVLSTDIPFALISIGGILFLFGKIAILGMMGKYEDKEKS